MPMKIVPMKPAIRNSISGSAIATAVLSCAIQIALRHVRDADELLIELAALFRDGNHFEHSSPRKGVRQSPRLGPSCLPSFTRSMEFETASTST